MIFRTFGGGGYPKTLTRQPPGSKRCPQADFGAILGSFWEAFEVLLGKVVSSWDPSGSPGAEKEQHFAALFEEPMWGQFWERKSAQKLAFSEGRDVAKV